MLIDVRDILRLSGLSKTVELELTAGDCGIGDAEAGVEFPEALYVKAELSNIKGMIRAKGAVRTGYVTYCARCLKPVHMGLEKEFDDGFVQFDALGPVSADDAEVYVYSDKEIDIGRSVRDAVLLDLPIRSLCSDGCLSLCPICGRDLNEGECGCEEPEGDDRFAALKGFFEDSDAD
ncbi:MAG: DUF177 domain-containing protein [Oscillospiraceae bacterium]|nr:DUF177 domain-containing protein [Oscillospiraceae bacterium]